MASIKQSGENQACFYFGDALPFGHELVSILDGSSLGSKDVQTSITTQLNALRQAVHALTISTDPDQQLIARSINTRFEADRRDDLPSMRLQLGKKKSILPWLASAKDMDLIEFGIWNVEANTQQQQALDVVTPQLRSDSRERLDLLIGLGIVPKKARAALSLAHRLVSSLTAIDSFEAGGMQCNGYFDDDTKPLRIAHSNQFADRFCHTGVSANMCSTNFHEDLHASSHVVSAGFRSMRILDECVVSHLTAVAESAGSEPEVMVPADRMFGGLGAYGSIRECIGMLASHATTAITIEAIGAAFFSDGAAVGGIKERVLEQLDHNTRELLPAFHVSGLRGLASAYEAVYATSRCEPTVAEWNKQICRVLGVKATMDESHIVPNDQLYLVQGIPKPIKA